jgi:hypothetical protein
MTNVIKKIYRNWTEYDIYWTAGADMSPATSATQWTVKLGSDTVQTVTANSPSATNWKTYPVQVNSSWQAVVNVPWTDWDVTWPSSSTNWHLAVFDWTTGKTIKDGGAIPTGVPSGWSNWQFLGKVSGSVAWANAPVTSVNWQTWAVSGLLTAETVASGDSWTNYTVKVSTTAPASWTANTVITFVK